MKGPDLPRPSRHGLVLGFVGQSVRDSAALQCRQRPVSLRRDGPSTAEDALIGLAQAPAPSNPWKSTDRKTHIRSPHENANGRHLHADGQNTQDMVLEAPMAVTATAPGC